MEMTLRWKGAVGGDSKQRNGANKSRPRPPTGGRTSADVPRNIRLLLRCNPTKPALPTVTTRLSPPAAAGELCCLEAPAMAAVPLVTLNSGQTMPVVGLGSAGEGLPPDRLVEVLVDAVEAGYRHFDTASLYGTEQALGRAVSEAVRRRLVSSRQELFITSKLWWDDCDPALVLPAIRRSLSNLGLDYLDLFLIHWPLRAKPDCRSFPLKTENLLPFDARSTWAAMEECQKLGLAKSIGVSNFSCKKLSDLLAHAAIPPAVNQVELNTSWDQRRLRAFCTERGIHITAYSPLGAHGMPWGTPAVMQSPVLKEIAAARGKSVANVALRWVYEQGVSLVVKSWKKERVRENLLIFDWELSEEERRKIGQIPQRRGLTGEELTSKDGPVKTVEELWDGEV